MSHSPFIGLYSWVAAAAGVGLLILFLSGCAQGDDADRPASDTLGTDTTAVAGDAVAEESIYETLREDGRFSTFVTAIDSADLSQTLSGPGPFTVFAPVDEAFGQMGTSFQDLLSADNEDDLRDLLLGHITSGERRAAELAREPVRTLAGGDLEISGAGDSLRVDDAEILERDMEASNGISHAVGRVLAPSMDDEGR